MKIKFELTGKMPLLMHNDNIEESDVLMAWRRNPANKGISVPGDDRSPAWTWQTYLYHDGENVCLPSANLSVALRQAGAQIIMKKQKTFKEASQSGMMIGSEFLPFRYGEDSRTLDMASVLSWRELTFNEQLEKVKEAGFRLFAKRATIGSSKNIRVRPRFDLWSVSGSVEVFAPELTFPVLKQLFEIAGRVGLCDWRPGCKTPGPFGMFSSVVTME